MKINWCRECNEQFIAESGKPRYCSKSCSQKARTRRFVEKLGAEAFSRYRSRIYYQKLLREARGEKDEVR